jgi:phage baseplate assembly protein W
MSKTTEEQAISNYVNLLLTKKGERYMQPEFGIGIQFYLFEQNVDSLRLELESEIYRQASFWLPYIINHKIDVRPKADVPGLAGDPENALQIVITFSVTEAGANRTIALFQKEGKISYTLT